MPGNRIQELCGPLGINLGWETSIAINEADDFVMYADMSQRIYDLAYTNCLTLNFGKNPGARSKVLCFNRNRRSLVDSDMFVNAVVKANLMRIFLLEGMTGVLGNLLNSGMTETMATSHLLYNEPMYYVSDVTGSHRKSTEELGRVDSFQLVSNHWGSPATIATVLTHTVDEVGASYKLESAAEMDSLQAQVNTEFHFDNYNTSMRVFDFNKYLRAVKPMGFGLGKATLQILYSMTHWANL